MNTNETVKAALDAAYDAADDARAVARADARTAWAAYDAAYAAYSDLEVARAALETLNTASRDALDFYTAAKYMEST